LDCASDHHGTALWTTLTDPQEIKSALEARIL
jgi:hypothetical protein